MVSNFYLVLIVKDKILEEKKWKQIELRSVIFLKHNSYNSINKLELACINL